MSRPLRIEFSNAWYHVMNRGAGRRKTFPSQKLYLEFLDLLGSISQEFQLEVHAYCLMDNHYHALIRTPQGNLNLAMQKLSSIYTRRHNKEMRLDGPLFRGRYKAILIAEEKYLALVSRYIHRNPIEAKICAKAEEFHWSSFRCYEGTQEKPIWLHTDRMVNLVSPSGISLDYVKFVNNPLVASISEFYDSRRMSHIMGNNQVRRQLVNRAHYQDSWHPENRPSLEAISEKVSAWFQVPEPRLIGFHQGRTYLPRTIALYLGGVVCKYPSTELASHFQINQTTVTQCLSVFQRTTLKQPEISHQVAELKTQLLVV